MVLGGTELGSAIALQGFFFFPLLDLDQSFTSFQLIRGKCWKVDKRTDGIGLKPGYDSHYSPGGNEIVIFGTFLMIFDRGFPPSRMHLFISSF